MKLTIPLTISNVPTWEELRRWSAQMFSQIVDVINGRISFSDNMDVQIADITFAAASAEVGFQHSLKRVPTGYILVSSPVSMSLFSGVTANTDSTIYLRGSAAGKVKVMIF